HGRRARASSARKAAGADRGDRNGEAVRLSTRRSSVRRHRRVTIRTRTLLSTLAGAAVALTVVTVLVSTLERRRLADHIARDLDARTRLAATLLADRATSASLDAEADRLARLTDARVTFIDV